METLRLFCDVARFQSFSQAAGEHGLTQSAVSQRIGALEQKLGAKLIDRSVRPLALTSAGAVFYAEARELVERFDLLTQRIGQMRGGPSGHLQIEAIYSAGIDLLNHIEEAFEAAFPQVKVDIHYKRPDEVYDAVRQERCDLGILSYPQRWPDVGVIPLRDERMVVVCHCDHELAERDMLEPADLETIPMIAFESTLPVARRIRRYLRENHAAPRVLNEFDNIDTIKNAVEVTDAFAILPRRTVLAQVSNGQLAMVPLTPPLTRPLGIIYHRRKGAPRQFTPAVQAFVDFLLRHAGPQTDLPEGSAPEATPTEQSQASRLVGGQA